MNITGGIYNGRKIKTPDEKITRPTLSKVRMSVFNTLYSILGDFNGKTFLDMFGGSGIMGLEAISRGFSDVVVFEKNKIAADIIKSNYKTLGLTPQLHIGNSLQLIKKIDKHFDIIYIDPPYESELYENINEWVKENNNLSNTIFTIEHNTEIDLSAYEIIKQKKYGDKLITFGKKRITHNNI